MVPGAETLGVITVCRDHHPVSTVEGDYDCHRKTLFAFISGYRL